MCADMSDESMNETMSDQPPTTSSLSARIIKRLGWSLVILGAGISLVILLYALSGSLYDGIGPIKLAGLLMGGVFVLAGALMMLIKPTALVEKSKHFLARITLIRSEIPAETWEKVEPVRWMVHGVGVIGIVMVYLYAISDMGFKGFGPLKLAAMALCGVVALFGFLLYLSPFTKFALWLRGMLDAIWNFIVKIARRLQEKLPEIYESVSAWIRKASGKRDPTRPVWKAALFGLFRIFWFLFRIIAFAVFIVLLGVLIFLVGRELYLMTVPEPIFYKRLIRGILLSLVIVVILFFSQIREGVRSWIKKNKTELQKLLKRNAAAFLIGLLLVTLTVSAEVFLNIRAPYQPRSVVDINPYDALMDLSYDYWEVRADTNQVYSFTVQPEKIHHVSDDYESQHYNVIQGKRVTVDQPENPEHRIHLFGGDILISMSTPDALTPSSLLQQKVNEEFGDAYAVVNHSSFAYYAYQSLDRLKTVDIAPEDVVVFVFGAHDSDFLNNPSHINFNHLFEEEAIPPDYFDTLDVNLKNPHRMTFENFLIRTNNFLLDRSAIYRAIQKDPVYYPDNFSTMEEVESLIATVSDEMAFILLEAYRYTTDAGGEFIAVLEPNLFTQSEFSARDYAVAYSNQDKYLVDHRFWTVPLAYAHFQQAVEDVDALDSMSLYDLSDIYDPEYRDDYQVVYVQWIDYLPEGNQMFADALYDVLTDHLER